MWVWDTGPVSREGEKCESETGLRVCAKHRRAQIGTSTWRQRWFVSGAATAAEGKVDAGGRQAGAAAGTAQAGVPCERATRANGPAGMEDLAARVALNSATVSLSSADTSKRSPVLQRTFTVSVIAFAMFFGVIDIRK